MTKSKSMRLTNPMRLTKAMSWNINKTKSPKKKSNWLSFVNDDSNNVGLFIYDHSDTVYKFGKRGKGGVNLWCGIRRISELQLFSDTTNKHFGFTIRVPSGLTVKSGFTLKRIEAESSSKAEMDSDDDVITEPVVIKPVVIPALPEM